MPQKVNRLKKKKCFLKPSTLQLENPFRTVIIGMAHVLSRRTKGQNDLESVPSDLWKMLSPKDRKKLIDEETEKMTGGSGGASSSSAPKGSEEKKSAVATARKLRVNPSPSGEPQVNQWEVIPTDRPKFCVPAMPKSAPAKAELHRPESRDMIKQKIQELEFKVALDLFSAVARLVPKDEVRKNPKAKAALDKEWENVRTKGVWDESRVRECKSIVDEARAQTAKDRKRLALPAMSRLSGSVMFQ